MCLAAPLWAEPRRPHTDPYKNHLTDTIMVDGKKKDVVSLDGVPIGPTWQGEFFLGADAQRSRHRRAAALRRAQLAADRDRRPR